jgi:hypothetical protein
MIVDGFCKQVFRELPMEFAVEAKKLLEVSLEGSGRMSTCARSERKALNGIRVSRCRATCSRRVSNAVFVMGGWQGSASIDAAGMRAGSDH